MKPVSYEGVEPYIFVSYAHRDAEQVFEVLHELQQRGYRFWYDDGIAPGSEWPEDIARHLDGAAMVMAFVTPNSMKSQNCRREINFSLSREKPFLSVLLEETDMPLGMQMQLSAQQSILRYNYDSWEGFIKKVLACPDLEPCRAEPEVEPAEPEPTPAPEPKPAEAPTAEPTAVRKPVTTAPTPAEPPVTKRGSRTKKPADAPKSKTPKKVAIALAAVVAVIAIVFAVRVAMSGAKHFDTSWGKQVDSEATTLDVPDGSKVEQADLDAIVSSMGNLKTLRLDNCDLSGCNISSLSKSAALQELSLENTQGISDYSFLSSLALNHLNVAGCEGFDDAVLAALDLENLKTLNASRTGISDLSPFANTSGLPLQKLYVADTSVKDLNALSGLGELQVIDASNTSVTSINELAPLTKLNELYFDGCQLGAVDTTFSSLRIAILSLAGTQVSDLSGLTDCTVIRKLILSNNPELTSLDWFNSQNCETLQVLDVSETGLTADDIAWLASCAKLETLRLDGVALTDLSFLNGSESLEYLSAMDCGINDISGLNACSKLRTILLGENRLTSVSALSGLALDGVVVLDLTNNEIGSLADLPVGNYHSIMLYGNAETIASTLPKEISAYQIVTPYYEGMEDGSLKELSNNIYVVNCPQDKVVRMEASYGSALRLITEDELWNLYAEDGFYYELGDMSYLANAVKGSNNA